MGPTAQIAVYFEKSGIWGPLCRWRSILKRIIAINLKIEFMFMFRISILVLVGGTSAALACKEQTSVLVLVGGTSTALACKEQTLFASSPTTFVYSKYERFSVRRFPTSSRLHAKSRHFQMQLICRIPVNYRYFSP